MKPLFVLLFLSLTFAGCSKDRPIASLESPIASVIKIVVRENGSISADGTPIQLEDLSAKIAVVKEKRVSAWLYTPDWQGNFRGPTRAVATIIAEAELPLRAFAKEDFSEYVGPDHKAHKEQQN